MLSAMDIVQHFEIPASDLEQARVFYHRVFGWSMDAFDEDTVMIARPPTVPGQTPGIGGDLHHPTEATHPTIVVTVDSIDATLDRIERSGGHRVGEIHELGGAAGRYAYFDDPEGNRIGLWDAGVDAS
jgi:predicted enzyme related to lactoylglutathione lyase